jgi:transketolase
VKPPLDEAHCAAIAAARRTYPLKAIRQQVGETMIALAAGGADFLVLTADLLHATGMAPFGERFPQRVINVGIAEQNLAGVAAGLALSGKLPFVSCYASFTTLRGVEQIKLDAAYNRAKVIFAAQSSGLSYGMGGPTHQTFEDVAIIRAIPNTIVLTPSDAPEVDACLRSALAHDADAPIYIRLGRGLEHVFNVPGQNFQIGKAVHLREGGDISIVANGSMVFEGLLASDFLKTLGIAASVLNIHTVKPIDTETLRNTVRHSSAIIIAEEHSIYGGLGAAVLEALSEYQTPPCRLVGIPDDFPPIGPTHELRAHLGLSAEAITAHALELLHYKHNGVQ